MSVSNQSFRKKAVLEGAASRFGGTAVTAASKGAKKSGFGAVDPRTESSKSVLSGLEEAIRVEVGNPAMPREDMSATLYFGVILSALRHGGSDRTAEVRLLLVSAPAVPGQQCYAALCHSLASYAENHQSFLVVYALLCSCCIYCLLWSHRCLQLRYSISMH